MINGNLQMFLDTLYLLEDLEVIFRGREYLIQGWTENIGSPNQFSHIEMFRTDEVEEGYDFQCDAPTNTQCATAFLRAKVWDGMDFYQAEREIEWVG